MDRATVRRLLATFTETLEKVGYQYHRFGPSYLLYQSHYDRSDPPFRPTPPRDGTLFDRPVSTAGALLDAPLVRPENLVIDELRQDLQTIVREQQRRGDEPRSVLFHIPPRRTHIIYNPQTDTVLYLNEDACGFIERYGGYRTLRAILEDYAATEGGTLEESWGELRPFLALLFRAGVYRFEFRARD